MYSARDILLAHRAKKAGAKGSLRIILEARRAGLPISLGFGLVDHETGGCFCNIFGCDHGAILCHKAVTKARVAELLASVAKGGVSNGVGLTQLTYPPFIKRADAMPGGASKTTNQLRVGFADLAHLVHDHGERDGLAIYNAGRADSSAGRRYARTVLARAAHYHAALAPKE